MLRLLSLLCILLAFAIPVQAEGEEEPPAGAVVCAPELYPRYLAECLPAGPAVQMDRWAAEGIPMPPRPFSAFPPDPSLSDLPYRYFRLNHEPVPLFSSIPEDPNQPGQQIMPAGFVYVMYTERVDTGKGIYYLTPSGWWVPGRGARVSEYSHFQGLQFARPPETSFGWTFETVPIRAAPDFNAPVVRTAPTYTVLQIYATQIVQGVAWNRVGIHEWVEARKVAQVIPAAAPPEGVTNGRWIDVNLEEQTLAVYEDNRLIFATVIASGMKPFWTRPGLFQISQKKEVENMRGSDPSDFYYLENVPWTMYFDGARALHGAYWRTRFGYPQSHGCVNLSVGDAHWLFNWAREGDWVYVYDPSGQTPTDPALYPSWGY